MTDRSDGSPADRRRKRGRDFDLVIFGASGFTGRLVLEYVAASADAERLRWAIAGRNRQKLERIRAEVAGSAPAARDVPILEADSHDRASLEAVASRTEAVCTTVGPYALHGSELVSACAEHGTDYCDLTGEVQWIRRMIDAYHDRAKETGARIIHCAGFDSIPSDLGTFMVQAYAEKTYGAPCQEVKLFVTGSRGGASGGTVASMINVAEEAKRDPRARRVLFDPYGLNPEGERRGPDGPDQRGVRFDRDLPGWTAPFVMASINTRVVRRSNALLGYRYGRDFSYGEAMGFAPDRAGWATAAAVAAGTGTLVTLMVLPPTRALLERLWLPKPGEGPSAETRERGFFKMRVVGNGTDRDGRPVMVRGRVEGKGDPGYAATARMLGESALCLAAEGGALESRGGVLTPAACMGRRLIERLRAAGMIFEIE